MSNLVDAAQKALEALIRADKISGYPNNKETIEDLRQAIDNEAKVAPAAWLYTRVQSNYTAASTSPNWSDGERWLWHKQPLYTRPQPTIPHGWQLVPVAPDWSMLSAGHKAHTGSALSVYNAMLAAAPKPPQAMTEVKLPQWAGLTDLEIEKASWDYTEAEGFRHGAGWANDRLREKNGLK